MPGDRRRAVLQGADLTIDSTATAPVTDEQAMELALHEARAAADTGEVPVGAVVLQHGRVIGTGCNAPIAQHDPTAHAEVLALRAAAQHLGNYRLDGCELFVTLEPCAMCVGAVLQARLARVVFGAPEPKSGAAGSVLDLFAQPRLNPHTVCTGGLLAEQSQVLLQAFFAQRREKQRQAAFTQRLHEDALRTPPQAFESLPDYPWQPHHLSDLPALAGLRLHFLDEGPPDAPLTWLCLHGPLGWSYQWRRQMPVWLAAGHRVVAVDLIGFGKSDKPKRQAVHAFDWHRHVLQQLIERLDLRSIVLAVPNAQALLGLSLPMQGPARFAGVLVADPGLPDADAAAWDAPFPDRGHRAALRWSAAAGFTASQDRAALAAFWRNDWHGQTMFAQGAQPAWFGRAATQRLADAIAIAGSIAPIEGSPHALAQAAVGYFRR